MTKTPDYTKRESLRANQGLLGKIEHEYLSNDYTPADLADQLIENLIEGMRCEDKTERKYSMEIAEKFLKAAGVSKAIGDNMTKKDKKKVAEKVARIHHPFPLAE